jgi:hypothetical protein
MICERAVEVGVAQLVHTVWLDDGWGLLPSARVLSFEEARVLGLVQRDR